MTNWLASRMLVGASAGLLYIALSSTTLVMHLGIEKYCLLWGQESESAIQIEIVCHMLGMAGSLPM